MLKISLLVFTLCVNIAAQSHFAFKPITGNDMTVLVRTCINPNINGEPLESGDEIGVFSSSGLCVGAIVWQEKNVAITLWGDDGMTNDIDGMLQGDIIQYRIWDKSRSREYGANVSYHSGGASYGVDGIAILSSLSAAADQECYNGKTSVIYSPHRSVMIKKANQRLVDIRGRLIPRRPK